MAPDYLVERGISAVPGKGDEVLIGLSAEQDTSEASQIRFLRDDPTTTYTGAPGPWLEPG
jgi:hypothetical protein